MNQSELDDIVKLARKYLDWGLTSNMRAITVGKNNSDQLVFRAYTDNPKTVQSDTDELSNMGVYVWSMVSKNFRNQWSECIPTEAPLKNLENLGAWIYIREGED